MDEYKKMEDTEIPPNRYLVVVADAAGWDDRKKIHEYGYKSEQIEGIYSIYEEAVKVFEKISRKRKPDKTIEIRKEQLINRKWRKCDELLTIKTTDPQGNISKRETFRYTTEYDMFYLRLARNQLSLIRKENKKWQHQWDIQSIIDVIDIVAPEIVVGTFPEHARIKERSFRCGDQQIDLYAHCYEESREKFTSTTEIRENGKLLFVIDSHHLRKYHLDPYVKGRFTDIEDVKKYLAEKYQDKTFEFVTECVPKVEEDFEHVSLSDIRKQKEKEASIKEDVHFPQRRRGR